MCYPPARTDLDQVRLAAASRTGLNALNTGQNADPWRVVEGARSRPEVSQQRQFGRRRLSRQAAPREFSLQISATVTDTDIRFAAAQDIRALLNSDRSHWRAVDLGSEVRITSTPPIRDATITMTMVAGTTACGPRLAAHIDADAPPVTQGSVSVLHRFAILHTDIVLHLFAVHGGVSLSSAAARTAPMAANGAATAIEATIV